MDDNVGVKLGVISYPYGKTKVENVFENRVLRMFRYKREEVRGWRKVHNAGFYNT
jgi:hypothetical protein